MELEIIPSQEVVYRLTGSVDDPREINYDLRGLHKKRVFVKGELQTVEYYLDFAPQTSEYSGLCVRETNAYYRQGGFVFMREKVIEWLLTDGSVGCTKTTLKYYELSESMQEGFTRRNNLVYQAAERMLPKIGVANTQDLIGTLKNEIENYERGYEQPLIDAVAALDRPYLERLMQPGLTIRAWLTEELRITYE